MTRLRPPTRKEAASLKIGRVVFDARNPKQPLNFCGWNEGATMAVVKVAGWPRARVLGRGYLRLAKSGRACLEALCDGGSE